MRQEEAASPQEYLKRGGGDPQAPGRVGRCAWGGHFPGEPQESARMGEKLGMTSTRGEEVEVRPLQGQRPRFRIR